MVKKFMCKVFNDWEAEWRTALAIALAICQVSIHIKVASTLIFFFFFNQEMRMGKDDLQIASFREDHWCPAFLSVDVQLSTEAYESTLCTAWPRTTGVHSVMLPKKRSSTCWKACAGLSRCLSEACSYRRTKRTELQLNPFLRS